MTDVEEKRRRGRQILFDRDSPCLWALCRALSGLDRRRLILWAFACAEEAAAELEKAYPKEPHPRQALAECRRWTAGEIKMPQAKKAVLACHAAAKELSDPWAAAMCHAVGQGVSAVHVREHAMGLPIYELTAIVRAHPGDYEAPVLEKTARYLEWLDFWEQADLSAYTWAKFL